MAKLLFGFLLGAGLSSGIWATCILKGDWDILLALFAIATGITFTFKIVEKWDID